MTLWLATALIFLAFAAGVFTMALLIGGKIEDEDQERDRDREREREVGSGERDEQDR